MIPASARWQNRYYTWGRGVWLFKYTMPISFQQVLIVLAVIVVLIPIWGRYNVAVLLFFLLVVFFSSMGKEWSRPKQYRTSILNQIGTSRIQHPHRLTKGSQILKRGCWMTSIRLRGVNSDTTVRCSEVHRSWLTTTHLLSLFLLYFEDRRRSVIIARRL